jgi:RND family efflux transporter MFP subunit
MELFNKLFFCFLILLVITGCQKKQVKEIDNIIKVETIKISEKEVYPSIRVIGNIVQKDKADITPLISGRIANILKDMGAIVKKGDILAILDQQMPKISLDQAKNNLQVSLQAVDSAKLGYEEELKKIETQFFSIEKSKAELDDRENNIKEIEEDIQKKKELLKVDGIPKEELDKLNYQYLTTQKNYYVTKRDLLITEIGYRDEDITGAGYKIPQNETERIKVLMDINTRMAKLQMKQAQLNYEKANLDLKLAQINYDETMIKSPINGIVGERLVFLGERVDEKTKLFTIIDTSTIYFQVFVTEKDAGIINVDDKCTFNIESLGQNNIEGKVTVVSPVVDIKSRTVEVRIFTTNNNIKLRSGMFGRGFIYAKYKKKEIRLPVTAMASVNENKAVVFVLKKNRVFKKSIIFDNEENDNVLIIDGLIDGEEVVNDPPVNLIDGMVVEKNKSPSS